MKSPSRVIRSVRRGARSVRETRDKILSEREKWWSSVSFVVSPDALGFPGIFGRGVVGGATAETVENDRKIGHTRTLLNCVEHWVLMTSRCVRQTKVPQAFNRAKRNTPSCARLSGPFSSRVDARYVHVSKLAVLLYKNNSNRGPECRIVRMDW